MKLNLNKPIVFFDLETTGLNTATDRIVEISMLRIDVNGNEKWYISRVNPEMPIPESSSAIHGIYDTDVANAPRFTEIAKDVAKFLTGCDLGGYNANKFDIPLLAEEFLRANIDFDLKRCRYIDVQTIFHKKEPRTLSAAYKFYCGEELKNAHSSKADTQATYDVLKAQIERYDDIENDVEKLAQLTKSSNDNFADFQGRLAYNDKGDVTINFGKHKGVTIKQLCVESPGYLKWILEKDFPLYTKKIISSIMLNG